MTTVSRTLADIQQDLSIALRRKTSDMLYIGRLLNEAKALVEHGEWLPWLRRHTALTERSAQNYMKAAAFVEVITVKNETVSDLHLDYLSPKAIYLLASSKYSGEIIEQVLAAAAAGQSHIGAADVRQIAKAGSKALILQGIEADQQAGDEVARLVSLAKTSGFETVDTWEAAREVDRVKREGAWEAEQAEAILDDGPDADLPLASEPVVASSEAFHVTTFERAIEMLRSVMTKSLSTFASANISSSDIEQITAFLQEVAKQIAQVQKARGAALAGGPETDERTLSPGDPKPGKHAGHPGPENVAQNPAPQEETDGERYIRLWHERERQYRDRVTKEAQELLDSQVRKRNQAAGWPCP